MAATMQFDYQAEQLLINKMVILFKEHDGEEDGDRRNSSASSRGSLTSSLASLRGGRKSPKSGKSPKGERKAQPAKPPMPPKSDHDGEVTDPDPLRRHSPARRSLLVRKDSKGGSLSSAEDILDGSGHDGDLNGGSHGVANNNGAANGDSNAGKTSAKKDKKDKKAKGGFLGLLGSKNKKNKEQLSPAGSVQKLQPLQRAVPKLDVRKALALEAQRLRNQQAQPDSTHHPRFGRSPGASSPSSPNADTLSPEQRRARMEAQARQTENLLQSMHAQQVKQATRSPPSSPVTSQPPASLSTPSSPGTHQQVASRSPVISQQIASRDPPATPSVAAPHSPPPSEGKSHRSAPPPTVEGSRQKQAAGKKPKFSETASRSPPATTTSPQLPSPRGPPSTPTSPTSASSALIQSERRRSPSPPLSPTLSELDNSPGQRRRAWTQRAAATSASSASSSPSQSPLPRNAQQPALAQQATTPTRQQGRRAMGTLAGAAGQTPPSPSSAHQDDDVETQQRSAPQRQSGRRGLIGLFQSITKGSPKQPRAQRQASPQRPQQPASPPEQQHAGPPRPTHLHLQQEDSRASPQRDTVPDLNDVARSLFHQQMTQRSNASHGETATDSLSFEAREKPDRAYSPTRSASYVMAQRNTKQPKLPRGRPDVGQQLQYEVQQLQHQMQHDEAQQAQPAQPKVQQVRPEVQRTEHLLHAERYTDQKPPLPRNAKQQQQQQDTRAAAEAALSSSSSSLSSSSAKKGKTYCQSCKKKCSGEVLRVQDKYFHIACFKCKVCRNSLAQGGFFCKDGAYYCTSDYQRQFGTKCAVCNEYVEGEVVSALGNTYHQKCFTCGRCRQAFPSGERVTYTGKEVLCARCVQIPVRSATPSGASNAALSPTSNMASLATAGMGTGMGNECAGCHEELKECQALIALDRQWHIWCFKCKACDAVLHGEYMGKDGVPYCEKDYQKKFGVKCAYCNRYISGKVLQAGDNHHFHPTCARCTKCGDPFGDGEEMYLQGGAIWHPRCGPGPTENGAILNGVENGHCTDTETELESGRDTAFDRMSSSAVSDLQFSIRSRTPSLNGSFNSLSRKYQRTGSPGLILREYKHHQYPEDISRIYTYSYLTEEPTQGYLKRPIDPYDKPPTSPHFHRPTSAASGRGSKLGNLSSKHGSRTGMTVLVDAIRSETPRPRSPHMNNEEPIELAHFPAAKPPPPGEQPKIEREDFPAPPYPYTDPERRRRWSDTYKGVPISDDEDENDGKSEKETEDEKLKREEKELSKIATGIGKVFLHNVREREKLRQWKMSHVDPRNASRTPSAAREPKYHLRYQSPVNASPSRNVDHPRPWEEDELMDRSSSYRSSVGRSVGAIPSYNVVSSLRSPPKPGYGLRSCTLPAAGRNGGYMGYPMSPDQGDYSFSGLGEKTHSTEFSSGKSDISVGSISEVDRRALNVELPASTTYTGGLGALRSASYSPHLRRSLPNMNHSNSSEPPKIYPYHLLVINNYRLPADVDRCNLERHLSDAEFDGLFGCSRVEFYRLPQWRRNELKRRVRLF